MEQIQKNQAEEFQDDASELDMSLDNMLQKGMEIYSDTINQRVIDYTRIQLIAFLLSLTTDQMTWLRQEQKDFKQTSFLYVPEKLINDIISNDPVMKQLFKSS